MPRKIKVIDVNGEVTTKVEESLPVAEEAEPLNCPGAEAPMKEAPPSDASVEPKLKKTSRSRKKVPEPEPVKEEELELEPIKVEEPEPAKTEEPKTETKTLELVPCPDCGKKLTARTLKYKHPSVCSAKQPPKEKKQKPEPANLEEPLRPERISRVQVRREKMQRLIAQAF